MKELKRGIFIFIGTYILLLLLSLLKNFADWTSPLYFLGPIVAFFFTYYVFEYLQKNINFDFAEGYIGFLYLILLYLGYWLAFRIYYGNIASLAGKSFSEFVKLTNINLFKYLVNCPYIYIALAAFAGWIAFFLDYRKE